MEKSLTLFPALDSKQPLEPIDFGGLSPRQDLTFCKIENEDVPNVSIHQSLLNGSLFRNTRFEGTDFSRCDFESVRIENCQFINCNFNTSQFRASDVGKSEFINCTFEGAIIVDARFVDVRFDSCSFKASFSRDCNYSFSRINNCSLIKSNTILNSYDQCHFSNIIFGNCTFLLHKFSSCEFSECAINADSIGQVYGVSKSQIESFRLIFLGEEQTIEDSSQLLKNIAAQYQKRKWLLPLAFLSFNFKMLEYNYLLEEVGKYLLKQAENRWPIKKDEVVFLVTVIGDLAYEGKISLKSLSNFVDILFVASDSDNTSSNQDILNYLTKETLSLINERLSSIGDHLVEGEPLDNDEKVKVTFRLKNRPALEISKYLNQVGRFSGLKIEEESATINAYDGSYIEIIWTTINTLIAFQLLLFCFEGTLVQITRIRARIKVMTGKRLPSTYKTEALSPKMPLQPELLRVIKKMIEGIGSSSLNPKNSGVSSDEIEEIRVEDD